MSQIEILKLTKSKSDSKLDDMKLKLREIGDLKRIIAKLEADNNVLTVYFFVFCDLLKFFLF
jgi:hypothetical protein